MIDQMKVLSRLQADQRKQNKKADTPVGICFFAEDEGFDKKEKPHRMVWCSRWD